MLAKEIRFIERFKGQPSKASQVQSRAKKIDKIEKVEPPARFVERRFDFRKPQRSGDDVIVTKSLAKSYGSRKVIDGVDLVIRRGERWAVMGENGAGKTTLLRMLAQASSPDSGTAKLGANVSMAWYAQHQSEQLNAELSVLEELQAHAPMANLGTIRGLAGAFV